MPADTSHPMVAPCWPPKSDIRVWRYMDVTRLLAFMEERSLHFARAGPLEDLFEGLAALLNQTGKKQKIRKCCNM